MFHCSQDGAFEFLRKVAPGGAGGRREKGPGTEEQHDGHTRRGGAPEGASPKGPIIRHKGTGEAGHDSFFEGKRDAFARRVSSGGGDQLSI